MKHTLFAVLAATLLGSLVFAEPCENWERDSKYNQLYNASTVETISGTVTEIGTFPVAECKCEGVHVRLQNGRETICVHLGPDWYINNQEIQIEKGDKLTVKGSLVTFDGKPAVLARVIVKDNHQLVLRTGNGVPAWSGWQTL